jgi:hypothetical protein
MHHTDLGCDLGLHCGCLHASSITGCCILLCVACCPCTADSSAHRPVLGRIRDSSRVKSCLQQLLTCAAATPYRPICAAWPVPSSPCFKHIPHPSAQTSLQNRTRMSHCVVCWAAPCTAAGSGSACESYSRVLSCCMSHCVVRVCAGLCWAAFLMAAGLKNSSQTMARHSLQVGEYIILLPRLGGATWYVHCSTASCTLQLLLLLVRSQRLQLFVCNDCCVFNKMPCVGNMVVV